MTAHTLMVQGTTSDAGKSLLVTALCRWLLRQGIRVAPFKPQNMALNSAVSCDGGEIGRAQAVQALACGLEPHTDMNPVLLKPNSDIGAQVIIHGHAIGNMDAGGFHDYKRVALEAVLDSHQRLIDDYEAVIVEGAGSPAEINLRANDIANMGFAEAVDCAVILVADIDKGGVFAHLVGTLALLSETERARIKGFVINRFRGDISLLQPGLEWLEQYTGKPVLGVLPYLHGLHLEAEDALPREVEIKPPTESSHLRIVVPALPRISNHTDFDPLRLHPQVDLQFIGTDSPVPAADLIILPGSKSVANDLRWLREQGWQEAIQRHLRYGGKLVGICGGFQMLGKMIHDPLGIESVAGSIAGLGLLELETTLTANKQLRNVSGTLLIHEVDISGYEIHAGKTEGKALDNPAIRLTSRTEGAISDDGLILGTYLHGLFESSAACTALLTWAGLDDVKTVDYSALREAAIERLADTVEEHLDTDQLRQLIGSFEGQDRPACLTLMLGGVRSGKSRLAEKLAIKTALPVTYIATATAEDEAMQVRITTHQYDRPVHWGLIEEPLQLASVLQKHAAPDQCLLVDCLTLWLTNLLLNDDEHCFQRERDALLKVLPELPGEIIFVSNETNMGITPLGELSRRYCDEAGWLHQELAQICQRVVLTVAGLPQVLKGKPL